MRIGLVMQGGAGWMGGAEYIRNLILALQSLPRDERSGIAIDLIAGTALDESFREQFRSSVDRIIPVGHGAESAGLLARAYRLIQSRVSIRPNAAFASLLRKAEIDFLYPLTYDNMYNIRVALPIANAFHGTRWAGWIPDFQHKHMSELFGEREIRKRDTGISVLADDAKTIVFSSETAAADFHAFCPGARARPEVLRFCTSPAAEWFAGDPSEVQRRYHLPDRFFLLSNQLWQHKNHLVVFEALKLLGDRAIRPHVVCTGQPLDFRNKDFINLVLRRLHELGVAQQVSLLGLIPRSDQIQLMRRSLAVIQPSLFEGWSTVVEDGRALGKTLLMSDIDVHIEQAPDGGEYFEKHSAASLAALLERHWREAQPGPAHDREHAAHTAASERLTAYGRRFLEIARG